MVVHDAKVPHNVVNHKSAPGGLITALGNYDDRSKKKSHNEVQWRLPRYLCVY